MQKLTDEQLAIQVDKLDHLPWPVWEDALDKLLPVISRLLHGSLVEDENHWKHLVGGYTKFGAHSSFRLGGEALYHYQTVVVEKLYDGSCEWKPENTLAEQLQKIACRVIPNEAKKYAAQMRYEQRHGYSSKAVSLDVEWMGKEDDYTGEEMDELVAVDDNNKVAVAEVGIGDIVKQQAIKAIGPTEVPTAQQGNTIQNTEFEGGTDLMHMQWEKICTAADDDPQLAQYVQIVGESKQLKDVREKGGYEPGDTDKLIKRLRRKVNKLK